MKRLGKDIAVGGQVCAAVSATVQDVTTALEIDHGIVLTLGCERGSSGNRVV
jgi:hypothetical protein